jgi:apolipoprotein N-acyltransferase
MAVDVPVRAYPPAWRWTAAILVAISRAMLPVLLWRLATANDPPITPPLLAELLLICCALPALAAWLIGRAFAARAHVDDGSLTLARGAQRVIWPRATVQPWRVPLPEAGCTLTRDDGARLALGRRDPAPLLAALGGDVEHPIVRYAAARAAYARGWRYWLGRYVLFALPIAAILFNAHQWIAYGGTFGQYYLQGAGAWLRGAAIYWATTAAYLLLWASLWRGVVETAALIAAALSPRRTSPVRRMLEWGDRAAFYGGSAAILALRFLD